MASDKDFETATMKAIFVLALFGMIFWVIGIFTLISHRPVESYVIAYTMTGLCQAGILLLLFIELDSKDEEEMEKRVHEDVNKKMKLKCALCGSTRIGILGKDDNGKMRIGCKDCGSTDLEDVSFYHHGVGFSADRVKGARVWIGRK